MAGALPCLRRLRHTARLRGGAARRTWRERRGLPATRGGLVRRAECGGRASDGRQRRCLSLGGPRGHLPRAGVRTRPYRPQTNGKAERASSRRCCASGPTDASTAAQPSDRASLPVGSIATTTGASTAPLAIARLQLLQGNNLLGTTASWPHSGVRPPICSCSTRR